METLVIKHKPLGTSELPNRIKVLHIIKSLGRGGAETLLPETLAQHNQELFEFHYIYFLPWKNQMVEQIEKEGGKISCFDARNNLQIFRKVGKLVDYIKMHQIQIIHCHLPWAGIVGRIAGKLTNIPVVYTEHNKWERYHKLTYQINKLSFGLQKRVIAVSEDVAQSIRKHYSKNNPVIDVVLNGTNTEKFSRELEIVRNVRAELNIPLNAIVIGIACVFRVQKRLETWLDIAAQLHQQFPMLHFIIAGDGPLKENIHNKANTLSIPENIHFVGMQSEIRPYLKAMDIFMMSSEFEGLPIALLEAMSMECMPACTAAGGIPELVKDGKNGVLVPVENPMLLVEGLKTYLSHPDEIKKASKEARKTVEERFGMNQMVDRIESIYQELLNSKS